MFISELAKRHYSTSSPVSTKIGNRSQANSAFYPQRYWNEHRPRAMAVFCGQEGNRRFGATLAMALQTLWYILLQAQWFKDKRQ